MVRRLVACLVFVASLAGAFDVRGAQIFVDPVGPLSTVSAAIDSAAFGDTLVLANAVYFENPLIIDKDLLIRGELGGRAVLDGAPNAGRNGNAGSVLRTVRSFVRLENLVLRNGLPLPVGAGVMIFGGHVTMRNVRLEGNAYGALSVQSGLVPGTMDLEDCEVVRNAFGLDGLVSTRVVRTRIEGNDFGLRAVGAIEMADVQIVNNGGPDIKQTGGCVLPLTFGRIERVVISNNRSAGQIGGLWIYRGPLQLIDVEISNNTAAGGPSGLACLSVDAELTNVTIKNNVARGPAQSVAGLLVDYRADVVAFDCTIENNDSEERGGGVSVQRDSNVRLVNTTITGNQSLQKGGGVYVLQSVAQLEKVILAANVAPAGGGMLVESGEANILGSTIAGNIADGGSGVLYNNSAGRIERSIIAFNGGPAGLFCAGGDVSTSCSNIFGNGIDRVCGTDLGGNLFVDPGFCNFNAEAGEFDFRLQDNSPLIDAAGCGPIGARGQGCGPTSVRHPISWSELKHLYGRNGAR